MFGMPKIPRTMLAIGIAAIIVVAYLMVTPAYEFDEGAPTASIHVEIVESETDEPYASGDIGIQPVSTLTNYMTTYPLTTYTADVPPLEPLLMYDIIFQVGVVTSGTATAETYTTTVTLSGQNPNNYVWVKTTPQVIGPVTYTTAIDGEYYTKTYTHPTITQQTSNGVEKTFDFTSNPFDCMYNTVDSDYVDYTRGIAIDGATFNLEIVSIGSGGSYGMTTATIMVVVGAGGTLSVEITGITTVVS